MRNRDETRPRAPRSGRRRTGRSGLDQVDVLEPPIAQHAFAPRQRQRIAPQRTGVHTGVELAVLAARIATRGQFVEQLRVEWAPAECGVELLRVDAAEDRAEAVSDEAAREARGVLAPQRKPRAPTQAREQALPVRAHVGEVKIAERDRADAGRMNARLIERMRERAFVAFVRSLRRNRRLDQRQVQARGLRLNAKDGVLVLLSLEFEPAEAPAGVVVLNFAAGGALRAEVECIDAVLTDLSAPWPTPRRPSHEEAEN